MGKAIVVGLTIIVIAIVIAIVVVYYRRKQSKDEAMKHGWATKGDLNKLQERALMNQNIAAVFILQGLLAPPSDLSGDFTVLSEADRHKVQAWLQKNQVEFSDTDIQKGIRG